MVAAIAAAEHASMHSCIAVMSMSIAMSDFDIDCIMSVIMLIGGSFASGCGSRRAGSRCSARYALSPAARQWAASISAHPHRIPRLR
ncbi:hypothetical protein GCM10027515_05860 [Schumannella luteola]